MLHHEKDEMLESQEYSIELGAPGQLETDFYRRFWTKLDNEGWMSASQVVEGRIDCDTEVVPPVVKVSVGYEDQAEPRAEVQQEVRTVQEAIDFTKIDPRSLELAQLAVNQFHRSVNFGGVKSSRLIINH